jgi:hypothetical protein
MQEKINEKVSVIMLYDRNKGTVAPVRLKWQGRFYDIEKTGYHHILKKGNTLIHIFAVSTKTLFFRLSLDTSNLHWTLEEIADGLAN